MELLTSVRLFLLGILKRIYWLLPTLILDPFDLIKRIFRVNYVMPQWSIWFLFSLGWVIAMLLTYHELRLNKLSVDIELKALKGNTPEEILARLSSEAKIILKEASVDQLGSIYYSRYMGGASLQTNGKNLINNQEDARERAKWESVLSELTNENLVSKTPSNVYKILTLGYSVADKIPKAGQT